MPSDYDRRRLEEIEAALRASDPGLDRALRTFRPRRSWPLACLMAGWAFTVAAAWVGWWILTLVMMAPLLALTFITLGVRWSGSSSAAKGGGTYPPSWTRFWG